MGESPILDAAYGYVESIPQWPILPIAARTKRPAIRSGRDHAEHATTDPNVLLHWYRSGLLAAIGMPTGAASGTVVLDVDAKHDGEASIAELEQALCPLPRTRVARTPSGGLHIYFAHPGCGIRVRTGAGARSPLGRLLCEHHGVDVRADGGLVVLAPSCGYQWIVDEDLVPIPALWLAAIQGCGDTNKAKTSHPSLVRNDRLSAPERGAAIHEGSRSDSLFRRGVALCMRGASEHEILRDLGRANTARCNPPLGSREVTRIAASAARSTGRRR